MLYSVMEKVGTSWYTSMKVHDILFLQFARKFLGGEKKSLKDLKVIAVEWIIYWSVKDKLTLPQKHNFVLFFNKCCLFHFFSSFFDFSLINYYEINLN